MSDETPVQPRLADLFAKFLDQQAAAHAEGVAMTGADAEVHPYEAGPVQQIDPALAWEEAQASLRYFGQRASGKSRPSAKGLQAPPAWPSLVAGHEAELALPWCVGNFPQLVRNFQLILHSTKPGEWRPGLSRPANLPQLVEWCKEVGTRKDFPQALVAFGALRLARQFDAAAAFVKMLDSDVPAEWRDAWENEKASLLWQRGEVKAARDAWRKQTPALPVLFNLGMAELFLGDPKAARAPLQQVVAQLPDSSAWRHLASLYLILGGGNASAPA